MAKMSSFLWLFGLIVGCAESQTNRVEIKMISSSPEAFHTEVQLMCETNYPDAGIFWILQKRDHSTHFILYVSVRAKMTPENKKGYKAEKSGSHYRLTIISFEEEDQGLYYCILHRNQALFFSSGLEVHLPKPPTPPPTIPHQVSTRSKGLVTEKGMECPPSTASGTVPSTIKCELYIWAPLAGGSFLLIILVSTISVCCGQIRRRKICKCKRPMDRAKGKLSLPR